MKATPTALLLLLLATLTTASAQSTTWTGATGLWDDDANWSDSAPAIFENAIFGNGTAQLPADTVGAYKELWLGTESGQTAAIQITGGLLTANERTYLGYAEQATGSASISDGIWNTGMTFVGYLGTGDLAITGGSVNSSDVYLGASGISNNSSATVTGITASWATSIIYVGDAGTGNSFTISDGASVFTTQSFIGNTTGSTNNTVAVSGGGSTWTLSSQLYVGGWGSANGLSISDGANVSNTGGNIGYGDINDAMKGSGNSVIVSGQGSTWINTGNLTVGVYGSNNTLLIEDGALVKVGDTIGETLSFSTLGSSQENYLRLDGGYIALFGNQITAINDMIADGSIQLWDGSAWVTATVENVEIAYYTNDLAGETAAEEATGYSGLGGYTVATAQAVPEPGSALLVALGFGVLALCRRRSTTINA